jgi:hypothetical protein
MATVHLGEIAIESRRWRDAERLLASIEHHPDPTVQTYARHWLTGVRERLRRLTLRYLALAVVTLGALALGARVLRRGRDPRAWQVFGRVLLGAEAVALAGAFVVPRVTAGLGIIPDYDHVYYDFTVRTRHGDAHFIATAPNAWNDTQRAWLDRVLAVPARYTFVLAHEPPDSSRPSGSDAIEQAMMRRSGGITLRLYGHVHNYQHPLPNAIVTGNAGAPLTGTGSYFGFVIVQQQEDANLVVTAYEIGSPPMVRDSFVLTPEGTLTR